MVAIVGKHKHAQCRQLEKLGRKRACKCSVRHNNLPDNDATKRPTYMPTTNRSKEKKN